MSPIGGDNRKRIVLGVIAEIAGADLERLKPETELVADLGIDSAKALSMLVELEDRLEVEIPDDRIAELNTVGDVLAALEAESA